LPKDDSLVCSSVDDNESTDKGNAIGKIRAKVNNMCIFVDQLTIESSDSKSEPVVPNGDAEISITEKNENGEQKEEEDEEEEDEDNEDQKQQTADECSDNECESQGSLTTVESTCILSDMVSNLTLIHETSSRPLPFVDRCLAQQFLNCKQNVTNTDETEVIQTLEHCFDRYFKIETLTGENSFDCYYCRSLHPEHS
jgi:hypothetical protein